MIYTVAGVADMLLCGEDKVREALNSGDLPGTKYGRDWIIPGEALYQRLVEKALDEAEGRRSAKPSTLDVVLAANRRRQARIPPPLGLE